MSKTSADYKREIYLDWSVGDLDRNDQRQVTASNGRLIATCHHECVESQLVEMESNAKLIACAPKMAKLLLRSYTHVTHGPKMSEVKELLQEAGVIE